MFCIPAWGKRGSQTDPNSSVAKTSWEDLKQSQKCPCSWQVLEQDDFKVPSSPNRSVIYDKSDFPVISSYGRITQVFCHHLPPQPAAFTADAAAHEGLSSWHSGKFFIASAAE